MNFSENILSRSINKPLYGGPAWKKEDIFSAIDELVSSGYGILGGDIWAFEKQDESGNPFVGIIKNKYDGESVFNWHSEKTEGESWEEFINRTKLESAEKINKLDAENSVSVDLKDNIFYNLTYVDQSGYEAMLAR